MNRETETIIPKKGGEQVNLDILYEKLDELTKLEKEQSSLVALSIKNSINALEKPLTLGETEAIEKAMERIKQKFQKYSKEIKAEVERLKKDVPWLALIKID